MITLTVWVLLSSAPHKGELPGYYGVFTTQHECEAMANGFNTLAVASRTGDISYCIKEQVLQ